MSNNTATSPTTAPAETPKPELVFDNVAAQTDRELAKLKKELGIDGATPDAKYKEIEKIEAFFREKRNTITKITRDEISKLKNAIQDDNQELEGQLQLTDSGSIELKNSADTPPNTQPETPPTASPEAAEKTAPEVFLTEPAIPEDLIPPSRDYVSKKPGNFFGNIILQFFGHIPWVKKWILGFKTDNEMKYTESSMSNIVAIKGAPINALINFDDLSIRDFRDILGQFGTLDFGVQENVEAAFLGKHADNPKYLKYHRIYNGIGDLANKIHSEGMAYDPVERMMQVLENSSKTEYNPDYITPEENNAETNTQQAPKIIPVLSDAEKEAEALKSAQEIDKEKTEAGAALAKEEAIPDNPEAINVARERLNTAEKAVTESIDASKKSLGDTLKKQEKELSDTTLAITTAERELDKAKKVSDTDPTNTELQTKKAEADKNLATLKLKEKNLKEALTDIRENLMKKFETPGVTTALEATQIMADVENKLAIAHGATEVVETRTENQTAEEKEKADKETEKVKKEKEKLFGIYNKIKLSNEKYFHDTEEGNIYLMGENGDLFRYKFSWDVLDSTYNLWHNIQMMWNSAKLITSYNLPKPTTWNFQGGSITVEKADNSANWGKTSIPIKTFDDNRVRAQMANDAPPIPDWYTS